MRDTGGAAEVADRNEVTNSENNLPRRLRPPFDSLTQAPGFEFEFVTLRMKQCKVGRTFIEGPINSKVGNTACSPFPAWNRFVIYSYNHWLLIPWVPFRPPLSSSQSVSSCALQKSSICQLDLSSRTCTGAIVKFTPWDYLLRKIL
eukprot:GFKZ01000584.1.p1 GENE.GFKZ01000584.1~~GFKZ01000584.1.p1  ORF type:complete len:146 (-),score=2.56 GFKZ01000584.1:95-532(-)